MVTTTSDGDTVDTNCSEDNVVRAISAILSPSNLPSLARISEDLRGLQSPLSK